MKLRNIFLASAAGLLALSSCSDKMNYEEYNVYDEAYIQEMFGRVGGFMTKIYNDIDYDFGNYSGAMLSSATDESVYSHPGNAVEDFYNGAWSATNSKNSYWTTAWDGISYCNLVLDNFSGLTFPEYLLDVHYKEEMNQYKNYTYEARWARAYFYFELVRRYKNIPLKTKHMDADEANALPQVSSDSIFQFIDAECAAIQDSIVKDYTAIGYPTKSETGRANKLAVMALRARAALYHASPLFNTNNDKNLWLEAAKRCNEVIVEAKNEGKGLSNDYAKMFGSDSWSDANAQKEIIFGRRTAASNSFEKYNFPIGLENAGGGNCPTQNLVDAFEMTNGKAINEEGSNYDPQNPYANRDKRLALIVARNGEVWPDQELETYVGGANSSSVTYGTPTSYYLKKYVNQSTIIKANGASSFYHIWITFRLAEFYLNYAEAALNYTGSGYTAPTGLSMTAAQAINTVRKRAGQPDLATNLDFDAFKKKYENERFVELAFEGHRFFDLRRWKEAPEYLKTIKKMTITKNTDGSLTYTPGTLETRTWKDAWYLFPFPQKDIMNCNYVQNPGY
ncbi:MULTISPECIES: RagB/SusD family nutrient uptake outer membrane protein [Segatella]|nr:MULTISPECIES: RagB/SusD family nutrient uptake outer membrane protein [Segatella]UKK78207.1 RagB/SusD family nutrient uptake outer membrane protein [Segatella baroniae B14]SEP68161.1 Starch-binding associating with outer membrane [Segatella baroniae B14]